MFVGIAVAFGALVAVSPASASLPPCAGGTLLGTDVTAAPVDNVFEVEGRITDICEGESTIPSGIQGTITVNGLTFNVPAGLNVDVGDPTCGSGDEIAFGSLNDPPSLVGLATDIASGTIVVTGDGSVTHVATCVFVEEAENGLVGVRTDAPPMGPDPGTMMLGGGWCLPEQW